jgi:hypothetical protein|tara:strand:- start:72 stop:911 length:840 start_codon:yes stop_codon:yes gene_type:complete
VISIIGLGSAASKIAEKFKQTKNYNVYMMNSSVQKRSKYKFKLKSYGDPEQYEKNIPDVSKFFANLDENVQFIIVGSSYSSNYSLGILEQIKDKKIDIFYICPDSDLMTGVPKLVDKAVFSVLQQYTRSGLLKSFTVLSNVMIEKSLGDIPIKLYYDKINESIFSTIHYVNYFSHAEPEIGMTSKPLEINRIRTYGAVNIKNLEENWFYELDMSRDICYYLCINRERLEKEGGLHKKIVDMLKEKPRNAFRKISYAIYETEYQDFGLCVAHTNAIQQYA